MADEGPVDMETAEKLRSTIRWLPAHLSQRLRRRTPMRASCHLIICLADHFEPSIMPENPAGFAPRSVQLQRLEEWLTLYPRMADSLRDADGFPLRHTCFFPAEQYDAAQIEMLAGFCLEGWGEIEIHLHHGVSSPDTSANTRQLLENFRDALVRQRCLARCGGSELPRYAFVHGNWTLANSGNGCCGVDDEMQILAETGCYADFTLPSAPNLAQTAKINSMYECALPLHERSPHRRGKDLRVGQPPTTFPLIIQGPLGLVRRVKYSGRRRFAIENGELAGRNPPSMERLKFWMETGIHVYGRPEWIFIKLHCHGMDPRDQEALLGAPMQRFLQDLQNASAAGAMTAHFVTAREMANIAIAACDGREGNPGNYRDYRFVPIYASKLSPGRTV
jgi:hypothetical protein